MDSNLGQEDAIVWVKVPGQSSDIRDPRRQTWLVVGGGVDMFGRLMGAPWCSNLILPM